MYVLCAHNKYVCTTICMCYMCCVLLANIVCWLIIFDFSVQFDTASGYVKRIQKKSAIAPICFLCVFWIKHEKWKHALECACARAHCIVLCMLFVFIMVFLCIIFHFAAFVPTISSATRDQKLFLILCLHRFFVGKYSVLCFRCGYTTFHLIITSNRWNLLKFKITKTTTTATIKENAVHLASKEYLICPLRGLAQQQQQQQIKTIQLRNDSYHHLVAAKR